jgi:hypothetical protein
MFDDKYEALLLLILLGSLYRIEVDCDVGEDRSDRC